jgi:5'-3' exonuclease
MNQQRSRRFRSAQEAKEKEQARKEAVAMFECAYTIHVQAFLSFDNFTMPQRWDMKSAMKPRPLKKRGIPMPSPLELPS